MRAARRVSSPCTSRRVARSVSAWALPRPSAMASAKLANSTVNHSQTETPRMNPATPRPGCDERIDPKPGGENAADEDVNITGLRSWRFGSSLKNESTEPAARSADRRGVELCLDMLKSRLIRMSAYAIICRCSTIGPKASAGTNVRAPTSRTCRPPSPQTAACASAACRRPTACISFVQANRQSRGSESSASSGPHSIARPSAML